jgi:Rv0078B-related antitoxin
MFDLPDPESPPSARLRLTLELYADGVDMIRRGLRRDFPQASDEELRRKLIAWLRERPGAEEGDCVGRPRHWVPSL